jgi:hypothetical protein
LELNYVQRYRCYWSYLQPQNATAVSIGSDNMQALDAAYSG